MVGYQTKTVGDSGFTLITPTFQKVDGSAIKLGDLLGSYISGESVQILNQDAATEAEYFFMTAEDAGALADSWYESDFATPANDIVVPAGSSILFASQGTSAIQFAGQVASTESEIKTGDAGFTMFGNCSPVDRKLSELTYEGISSGDSIQFMNADLATEAEYFFMSAADSGADKDAWYESDFVTPADDIVIPAGVGVLFSANAGSSVTIKIPSAL